MSLRHAPLYKGGLSVVKRAIESTGYAIVKIRKPTPQSEKQITPENFYDLYFSSIDPKEFFFVQIGAHDGVHGDPIHRYVIKYSLSGIVVEPQADVFEKLKETYRDHPTIKCVRAAVGTDAPSFYTVKGEYRDADNFNKMTRIASFSKEAIKKSLRSKIPKGADPENYIQETAVPLLSFDELTRDVSKIDFLQIDTEGYDWEILKMVDFGRFDPKILNFESQLFSDQVRTECEEKLSKLGYKFFRTRSDTCAYKA